MSEDSLKKPFIREDGIQCPDFAEILSQTSPDESLFEQIAVCYADRLEGFARYICRDETRALDAFQDAMVAAMKYLDTYRGDSPIEPWLRRILVSACARQRRGKKNDPNLHKPLDTAVSSKAMADPTPDQELHLMLKERLDLLYREIETLGEPNRSLLKGHDIDEVPIAVLADQFDLTKDAVKSRLKRARAEVRENLMHRL
ncbi:MAG: sigma-70 family RNA polymerase sigma factor [Myxococcota bacterium]|nr:sigma-70 family RNA polymerase sigma factor [Myxococcota bacterium]